MIPLQAQVTFDYQILLKYCINVSHMLPDTGRKIDLLNSWAPAVGVWPESAVEVGATVGGAAEVLGRVFRGVAEECIVGVDGVVVTLTVVHIDAGGAEYSSHWPCKSAP